MKIEDGAATFVWELLVDSITLTVAGGLGGMAFYFMREPSIPYSLGGLIGTIIVGTVLIGIVRILRGGERPI